MSSIEVLLDDFPNTSKQKWTLKNIVQNLSFNEKDDFPIIYCKVQLVIWGFKNDKFFKILT
jgi:hypothetical protein